MKRAARMHARGAAKLFLADLHVHTALSPCASMEMTPPAIVRAAMGRGLDMVVICDHNSAGNAEATQLAAGADLAVLAGIELTTVEEVHVLGIFPDSASANACAAVVLSTLPRMQRQHRNQGVLGGFGDQRLLDSRGQQIGIETRMLSAASTLSLEQAVALVKVHGGLAIAAHVDRPSFSVMSQLGVFPARAGFDAIEVFDASSRDGPWERLGLPVVHSSDSHFLADIGRRHTRLELRAPTFQELRRFLTGGPGDRASSA